MVHFFRVVAFLLIVTTPAFAEKLVDPTIVAPEYREAAEHRRAEQLKQRQCSNKANLAKIVLRDRAAFVLKCMDADASK